MDNRAMLNVCYRVSDDRSCTPLKLCNILGGLGGTHMVVLRDHSLWVLGDHRGFWGSNRAHPQVRQMPNSLYCHSSPKNYTLLCIQQSTSSPLHLDIMSPVWHPPLPFHLQTAFTEVQNTCKAVLGTKDILVTEKKESCSDTYMN